MSRNGFMGCLTISLVLVFLGLFALTILYWPEGRGSYWSSRAEPTAVTLKEVKIVRKAECLLSGTTKYSFFVQGENEALSHGPFCSAGLLQQMALAKEGDMVNLSFERPSKKGEGGGLKSFEIVSRQHSPDKATGQTSS